MPAPDGFEHLINVPAQLRQEYSVETTYNVLYRMILDGKIEAVRVGSRVCVRRDIYRDIVRLLKPIPHRTAA